MTREERRALLGDDVIARIEAEADTAIAEHPPAPELLDRIRPVLSRPALSAPVAPLAA
ncbi:hypothetical protein ACFY40_11355 [Streptomyces sp. NPDC012950]|uniref:hypothetical protein n=1 Tax=Streptomyces sp. NPDC012950 TaxID=3364858 RepID=UPI0036981095